MNTEQLYLNDQLVDLTSDSPISITYQINDLADMRNQQGNASNQFKIPMTQRNRAILGFADEVTSASNTAYTQLKALYIQDGIEIFANAIAEINSSDEQFAYVVLLGGNVGFFDLLCGQLADMGDTGSQWSNYGANLVWTPYDHVWDLDNVANSQQKLDGWIWPVVDYGLLSDDFNQPVDVRFMRPGFFLKTAIDLLVKSTGYKAMGSILSNPLYEKLIVQFSNSSFDHGLDYQNQTDNMGLNASTAQDINVTEEFKPGSNKGIIYFNNVIGDPSHRFAGNSVFTATKNSKVNVSLRIPKFRFQGQVTGSHPSSVKIQIHLTDTNNPDFLDIPIDIIYNLTEFQKISGSGSGIIGFNIWGFKNISCDVALTPGLQISVHYEFFGDQPNYFTMYSGATLLIKANNQEVLFDQTVQCERIFPDLSQKDLLKDTLQRFGIICQTDCYSATISFNSLKDIVNNIPIAKNWSSKCVNQGKSISFRLSDNYAQLNYMEYQTDPNNGLTTIPLRYGWSSISIDDKTLSSYPSDLILSKFGPSLNRPYIGGVTALIEMVDKTTESADFTLAVAPRLLISNKVNLLEIGKTVTFTDGTSNIVVNDFIDCPYFYKPGGEYSLMWDDLRDLYYTELQQILKQCKKVTRFFMLSPVDVHNLDLLIPIFLEQDSAYYYVNKIDGFIHGRVTKVELIKIS